MDDTYPTAITKYQGFGRFLNPYFRDIHLWVLKRVAKTERRARDLREIMKILVVESQAAKQLSLVKTLQSRGHQAIACEIEAAWQSYLQQAPVLVFLGTGDKNLRFCRQLCSLPNNSPTVIVTLAATDPQPLTLEDFLDAGAEDCLLASLSIEDLDLRLRAIEKRVPRSLARNLSTSSSTLSSEPANEPAIKQFPYIASHHLRQTLIQVKKQLNELLAQPEQVQLDSPAAQRIRNILDRASFMQRWLGELLLDLSKEQEDSLASLNPARQNYLLVDCNLAILEHSPEAKRFADHPHRVAIGEDIRLSFPEIVGLEKTLATILTGNQFSFELPAISRVHDNKPLLYFDLYVSRPNRSTPSNPCLLFLLNDATERMIFQQKLVQSINEAELLLKKLALTRDYVAEIIASMADALIVTTNSGFIKTVNPAAETLFGYSPTELRGQAIALLIADDRFLQQAHEGNPSIATETLCQRKTGEQISVAFSCAAITTEEESTDFVYIGRDVTARKQAEAEIQKLNISLQHQTTELETANQELEAFSRNVAHDLRSPLSHIDFFVQALEEEYGDRLDETGKDYLQQLQKSQQRMDQLIRDLLQLSKISRSDLKITAVNLSAMVREIVGELERDLPQRQVEWTIAPNAIAQGNAGLLKIALENLLGNAWKYSSKRAIARIEFGVSDPATLSVSESLPPDSPVYFLKDNGAGFQMDYADKLFSAFGRLHSKREFEGTGIGLAIVHRIIERHGGKVWAQAAVDEGATFYFTLSA